MKNGKFTFAGALLVLLALGAPESAMARGGGGGGGGGKGGGGNTSSGGNTKGASRVKRENTKKKDPKKLEAERERLRQLDYRDRDAGADREPA